VAQISRALRLRQVVFFLVEIRQMPFSDFNLYVSLLLHFFSKKTIVVKKLKTPVKNRFKTHTHARAKKKKRKDGL